MHRARHPPLPRRQQARPGSLQSWSADVIEILREAHQACEDAWSAAAINRSCWRSCASVTTRPSRPGSRTTGTRTGMTATTGYALGCWLRAYADQVWLFTGELPSSGRTEAGRASGKGRVRRKAAGGEQLGPSHGRRQRVAAAQASRPRRATPQRTAGGDTERTQHQDPQPRRVPRTGGKAPRPAPRTERRDGPPRSAWDGGSSASWKNGGTVTTQVTGERQPVKDAQRRRAHATSEGRRRGTTTARVLGGRRHVRASGTARGDDARWSSRRDNA